MATLAFIVPLIDVSGHENRRFVDELTGPHRSEYEASRRRMGVTAERVWIQHTPDGPMTIVYWETDDPQRAMETMMCSNDHFDVWFRARVREVHGIDFNLGPPGPPPEQILDWTSS